VTVVGIEIIEYGWGPTRLLIRALEELGYQVDEVRYPLGRSVLTFVDRRPSSLPDQGFGAAVEP
jgi:hypothetical protein